MGNENSSIRNVFEMLDCDKSGVLHLDEILSIHKLPGISQEFRGSPLLLFRFDTSKEGSINFSEFKNLLKYLKLVEKKSRDKMKSKQSLTKDCNTTRELELDEACVDRDSSTPVFIGKAKAKTRTSALKKSGYGSDAGSNDSISTLDSSFDENSECFDDDDSVLRSPPRSSFFPSQISQMQTKFQNDNSENGNESENGNGNGNESDGSPEIDIRKLKQKLEKETKKFFDKFLKDEAGHTRFLEWLFKLADTENTNSISAPELERFLVALERDGIDTDDLSHDNEGYLDDTETKAKSVINAKKLLGEYDKGRTGVLTREEFMLLAKNLVRIYQFKSSKERKRIGEYEMGEVIGRGANSKIKVAKKIGTREKKAVKIIKKGNVASLSKLDNEIKAMMMLDHPNIVCLEQVFESEEEVFFVEELCSGGSVADWLDYVGKLPEENVRGLFLEIVTTLQYCHSMGVCHRDLKLENILLDQEGRVKIADLGHAGIFSKGWDIFDTPMVGSISHLAPEQINGNCYSGEKNDMWSMGVMLYRLLSGKLPFVDSSFNRLCEIIDNIMYNFTEDFSAEAKDLVQLLLQKKPDERPSTGDILEHAWFKGPIKKFTTMCLWIPIRNDLSLDDSWNQLKDNLKKNEVSFLEDMKPEKVDNPHFGVLLKCSEVKIGVKFTIVMKEMHVAGELEKSHLNFEFALKYGYLTRFRKLVTKLRNNM